mmetsp:Transcript_22701/g.27429  ORF Transcript_22701/g.27429 Transcript_22701/m.27429 type:complete len:226 (-) Transcript_22701:223-900(-)
MLPFPVNDRSSFLFSVHPDCIPDLGHPGTSSVHYIHLTLIQELHLFHGSSEGRKNYNVTFCYTTEILVAVVFLNELHVHLSESLVDDRVVNDLVGNPDSAVLELIASLIRHLDRSFYPPAKSKRLSKLQSNVTPSILETSISHLSNYSTFGSDANSMFVHLSNRFLISGYPSVVQLACPQLSTKLTRVKLLLHSILGSIFSACLHNNGAATRELSSACSTIFCAG